MSKSTFCLEIITPTYSKTETVDWVEVQSPSGSFLIGHDHSPLVSAIKKKSILTYKLHQGKKIALEAYGGMFKILDNKATALLDQ